MDEVVSNFLEAGIVFNNKIKTKLECPKLLTLIEVEINEHKQIYSG